MAAAIHNHSVAKRFRDLEAKLSADFNAAWLSTDGSSYATGKQTELAIPLYLGLVPKEHVTKVLASLVGSIEANDYHVTTGILGTRALYEPSILFVILFYSLAIFCLFYSLFAHCTLIYLSTRILLFFCAGTKLSRHTTAWTLPSNCWTTRHTLRTGTW